MPIASQRFSVPTLNADFAVELIVGAIGQGFKIDLAHCLKDRGGYRSRLRIPRSSSRRPSGLIITIRPALIQDQHAAGHGIDHLLQRGAHAVVLGQAAGQRGVALGELGSQTRDFALQIAIGSLKHRTRQR